MREYLNSFKFLVQLDPKTDRPSQLYADPFGFWYSSLPICSVSLGEYL